MVEARNITKRYGPFIAVEDLEFSVDKDELLQQILRDMEVPPWK